MFYVTQCHIIRSTSIFQFLMSINYYGILNVKLNGDETVKIWNDIVTIIMIIYDNRLNMNIAICIDLFIKKWTFLSRFKIS